MCTPKINEVSQSMSKDIRSIHEEKNIQVAEPQYKRSRSCNIIIHGMKETAKCNKSTKDEEDVRHLIEALRIPITHKAGS